MSSKDFKTKYFEKYVTDYDDIHCAEIDMGMSIAYKDLFPIINEMRDALELHKKILELKQGQRITEETQREIIDMTKLHQALKNLYEFVGGGE